MSLPLSGHNECVRILLAAGAGPPGEEAACGAVYAAAVESGNLEAIRLLIDAGKSVNVPVRGHGSVIQCAARWGYGDIVQLLIDAGAYINGTDNRGTTPLIAAARECRIAMGAIKQLVTAKCDLNRVDHLGKTALHYCAHKGLGVEVLLKAGATPDVADKEGNTPMHLASIEGFDAIVKLLLEHGANPDVPNVFQNYPIHYLAMKNHHDAISAIMVAGGDVNALDMNKSSPLLLAVNYHRVAAVKALLQGNCRTDPPDDAEGKPTGGVPVKVALDNKWYGVAKLLILAGCNMAPVYEWWDVMAAEKEPTPPSFWPAEESSSSEDEDAELDAEAKDWIRDWLHTPHTLKQMTRIYVRRILGQRLHHTSARLPLPPVLVDYVTLKEVHDHHIEGFERWNSHKPVKYMMRFPVWMTSVITPCDSWGLGE